MVLKNAKRQTKLLRMTNQAKIISFCTASQYKYKYKIPSNYNHAKNIDLDNSNTTWHDYNNLEIIQLDEFDMVIDSGKDMKPPDGNKRIKGYLMFYIKHNRTHKARCVSDGHLIDIPIHSFYSGVVSLRGLHIVLFLPDGPHILAIHI